MQQLKLGVCNLLRLGCTSNNDVATATVAMKWGALQVSVGVTGVLRGPSGPALVCVGVNAFSQ